MIMSILHVLFKVHQGATVYVGMVITAYLLLAEIAPEFSYSIS